MPNPLVRLANQISDLSVRQPAQMGLQDRRVAFICPRRFFKAIHFYGDRHKSNGIAC